MRLMITYQSSTRCIPLVCTIKVIGFLCSRGEMHLYKVSFGKLGRVGERRDDVGDENETDVFFMNFGILLLQKAFIDYRL